MKVEIIIENLRRTITGKEKALAETRQRLATERDSMRASETMIMLALESFLDINLTELRAILRDVEMISPTESPTTIH